MVIKAWLYSVFCAMKKKIPKDRNKDIQKLAKRMRALRIKQGYTNYENFAFDKELPRAQYGRYEKGEDIRYSS